MIEEKKKKIHTEDNNDGVFFKEDKTKIKTLIFRYIVLDVEPTKNFLSFFFFLL